MAEAKKPAKAATKKTTVKAPAKKAVAKPVSKDVKVAEKAAVKETTEKIAELVETEAIADAIIEVERELDAEEAPLAKAGKRSAKALKEVEEKSAKEERKKSGTTAAEKPKQIKNPTRTKLERQSKKMRDAAKLIDQTREYGLKEALELATKTSTTKFDATVEMHVNLSVDPRQADQNVRDNLVLPQGTGKSVRVAVFAEADDVAAAKKAGADIAGTDDFLQQLDKGKLDFDVLIATPTVMARLGKYARVLGPKGLMPNPKSGTVTKDVTKAVKEAQGGRVEYRVDPTGIVHLGIGKVSFGTAKLLENAQAVTTSLRSNKPASVKANYVKSVHITTSMGPSIKMLVSEI